MPRLILQIEVPDLESYRAMVFAATIPEAYGLRGEDGRIISDEQLFWAWLHAGYQAFLDSSPETTELVRRTLEADCELPERYEVDVR